MRNRLIPILLLIFAGSLAAAPPTLDTDSQLQASLERVVQRMALTRLVSDKYLAVSLYDISSQRESRYAGINDREMIYAASLPKIAVLLAGFNKISEGEMPYTEAERGMFTRMIRRSSNEAASQAIQEIGFEYIAQTLTCDRYKLYDRDDNGGLWIGKGYGGPHDRWRRDPLHNLSHGANTYQVTRFFAMLDQGELVSPYYSAEMKKILSQPGIMHKFVKGLSIWKDREIYRKSGTWRDWHCDAALIEAGKKRYIAAALVKAPNGGDILVRLIRELDRLVVPPSDGVMVATASTSRSRPQSFDARPRN